MIQTKRCMQIHQELKTELDGLKNHPRDTYEMIIQKLVNHYKKSMLQAQASKPVEEQVSHPIENPEVTLKIGESNSAIPSKPQ